MNEVMVYDPVLNTLTFQNYAGRNELNGLQLWFRGTNGYKNSNAIKQEMSLAAQIVMTPTICPPINEWPMVILGYNQSLTI